LYSQRERKNIETTSIKASFSTTTVSWSFLRDISR
jgi:hypothetical protein